MIASLARYISSIGRVRRALKAGLQGFGHAFRAGWEDRPLLEKATVDRRQIVAPTPTSRPIALQHVPPEFWVDDTIPEIFPPTDAYPTPLSQNPSAKPALKNFPTTLAATPQPKLLANGAQPPTTTATTSPENSPTWNTADFWAFLDSFLNNQNSAHTKRAYELDLIDFLTYLKATDKQMNVHTLIEYRETLQSRISPRTGEPLSRVSINRKIATIKSFLNWLVINGVIPNNPAKAVKSFRAGRESPTRDVPNDRVRQMLLLPHRHRIAGRLHHAILMVLFHLGLRRAELVGLRTTDLFEQEGMRVMRIRGKGDKERILPIPPEVAKSIDTYIEMAQKRLEVDQPLFSPVKNNVTRIKDKPLHPNAIAYIVKHYAKLAGVDYRVSPHSARATAVSNALDNHAPHRAVQYMAGWSSPLMVTRYDKRKQELRNSAVRFVSYSGEAPPAPALSKTPTQAEPPVAQPAAGFANFDSQ